MVRVGLLLYGYKPFESDKIQLLPILKIKAKHLFQRKGIINQHLMYGKNLSSINDVSIIRLGYGDGFFRKNGSLFANNLCMDLSAINKKVDGEYVVVMDDAEKLSKELGTISYEILVSVTKNAEKKYIN